MDKTLASIEKVTETSNSNHVNKLLGEGWLLLGVFPWTDRRDEPSQGTTYSLGKPLPS